MEYNSFSEFDSIRIYHFEYVPGIGYLPLEDTFDFHYSAWSKKYYSKEDVLRAAIKKLIGNSQIRKPEPPTVDPKETLYVVDGSMIKTFNYIPSKDYYNMGGSRHWAETRSFNSIRRNAFTSYTDAKHQMAYYFSQDIERLKENKDHQSNWDDLEAERLETCYNIMSSFYNRSKFIKHDHHSK